MADHSSRVRSISVAVEPFDASDSRALREELGADLVARYAGDSEPGAKPSAWDVTAFLVARDCAGQAVGCGALRALADGVAEIKRSAGYTEIEGFGDYAGNPSRCFERRLMP